MMRVLCPTETVNAKIKHADDRREKVNIETNSMISMISGNPCSGDFHES
jgi:hypothetical protein